MNQTETPRPQARTRRRAGAGILAGGLALALTLAGIGVGDAQTGSPTTTDPSANGPSAEAPAPRRGPGRHHAGAKLGLATAAKVIGISEADLLKELRAGRSIAQVARSRNVDVKKVVDALVAEARTRLAAKVAAGELTQARADEMSAKLTGVITAHVNRAGPGRGGPGRRGHGPGRHHAGAKLGLATAAKVIGISEADLLKELRAGRSIAQVARSRNVDVKKVVDALVAEARTRLAAKVAAGELTQAQADQKLATWSARITEYVDRTGLDRPGEGPRPHRRGGSSTQSTPPTPDA